MPGLPSVLTPRRLPLEGTLAAPWAPLRPSQAHPDHGVSPHLGTSDNLTQWDPWSGGDNLNLYAGDSPTPLPHRAAVGNAYVTPSHDWNLTGPGGWDDPWAYAQIDQNGRRGYFAFANPKPGQAMFGTRPQVRLSLPSLPPPQPFLGGAR